MSGKLIHIATIFSSEKGKQLLYLRQVSPRLFCWFDEDEQGEEKATAVQSDTIEEAIRLGSRHWKNGDFYPLNCGFRYTLPERDEHGMNALFHQMAASAGSFNGIYYDDELGNNCFVQNAPQDSLKLLHSLKQQGRI